MRPLSEFKRGEAKVRSDWKAGHYDRALAKVNRLLSDWPDNPHLLVMWADLIQLQDTQEGPTLIQAKAAYQRAAELDNQSPAALIELGHFVNAIEDDADAAATIYAKAVALGKDLLAEALLGQAKALEELNRNREALACVAEAYLLRIRGGEGSNGTNTGELLEQFKDVAQTK